MKKILSMIGIALLAASCTDDYTDWASPFKTDPETAKTVSMTVSPAATIDFSSVTATSVQAFVPSVTVDDESVNSYTVELSGEDESSVEVTADENGYVETDILETAVYALYGQRPVTRTIPLTVTGYIAVGGQTFKSVGTTTLSCIPNAPDIEASYYITGTINGWDNTDTTYELTNDGSDPYENSTFTCRIPAPEDGSNVEFKCTPKSGLGGDWSKCLGSTGDGKFAYNNGGDNFVIEAVDGAKFYDLTFDMMEQTWSYTAISFDQYVYFIGATDGWSASDQKVEAVSDGVYTGYVYIADPNGWGIEFKFQKRAGDWADDSQLNSNNMAEVTGDFEKTGDNFKASAGEGVYFVELDLNTNILKGTFIKNMNLVGDFNGWNAGDDSQQMTWDADNFCYVITGAGVTANGWKFTTNDSWDINLGSNDSAEPSTVINDLVANGKNIGAVGTTIKLYPTRKTSDKIYCTVE